MTPGFSAGPTLRRSTGSATSAGPSISRHWRKRGWAGADLAPAQGLAQPTRERVLARNGLWSNFLAQLPGANFLAQISWHEPLGLPLSGCLGARRDAF